MASTSQFYLQTHGLTFLTVKHLGHIRGHDGPCFSYVNQPGQVHSYNLEHWSHILPFMQDGRFYVIPARVTTGMRHATLIPIGIIDSPSEIVARNFAKHHYIEVSNALWDPTGYAAVVGEFVKAWRDNWESENRLKQERALAKAAKSLIQF